MLLYAGRFSYAKARSDGQECEEDLAAAAKAKSKGGRQLIGGLLIFINFGVPSLSLSTYIFSGSVEEAVLPRDLRDLRRVPHNVCYVP